MSLQGIFVSKVTPCGPSDKGGLKVEDKILKVSYLSKNKSITNNYS